MENIMHVWFLAFSDCEHLLVLLIIYAGGFVDYLLG